MLPTQCVRHKTQVLTGYSTFVSDPHFLTNDLLDQQAAEQVNFLEIQ